MEARALNSRIVVSPSGCKCTRGQRKRPQRANKPAMERFLPIRSTIAAATASPGSSVVEHKEHNQLQTKYSPLELILSWRLFRSYVTLSAITSGTNLSVPVKMKHIPLQGTGGIVSLYRAVEHAQQYPKARQSGAILVFAVAHTTKFRNRNSLSLGSSRLGSFKVLKRTKRQIIQEVGQGLRNISPRLYWVVLHAAKLVHKGSCCTLKHDSCTIKLLNGVKWWI